MSLRWKLVGLFTLVLAAMLFVVGVLAVGQVANAASASASEESRSCAGAVGSVVECEGGRWFLDPESGLEGGFGASSGRYYVVRTSDGAVVLASALAPADARTGGLPPVGRITEDLGRRFHELTVTVQRGADEEEPLRNASLSVSCGRDEKAVLAPVQALAPAIRTIPVALLISIAGGWLIARRALRPIDRIARTAEEIGATDLSRRIDVRGRDEVARLAGTLNETFARLESAFERQQRFAADASHELRTPLSVVAGNVEHALKRERTPEEYRVALRDIGEAAARMGAVVEGLLTLARADSGRAVLVREPVALRGLCDDVVRLHRSLAEKGEVALSVGGDDEQVVGDRERLKELVSNLVTNAIRYNRPQGRVDLRLSRENGAARLEVADTGIGIAEADLPRVFERFYRVDEARSRERGGSGLGLAIAKAIAEAHGGSIAVTSRAGEGSRFVVTLPRAMTDAGDSGPVPVP